jgi:TRAP-type mannitol/chloroaromatic compound transport system substrate-binding protein
MTISRREAIKSIGLGALAATGLAACGREETSGPAVADTGQRYNWNMVTTWPPSFPGLGTGAEYFARTLERITGGRISVTIYGANELVPAFEVFDAVAQGTAQLGHGAAYYWKGKSEATQFFGAVPFGLNAQQMNGWLYQGGGLELWREIYAPFGIVPFPCGSTGTQMGGWFNREINSMADIQDLKMRIPGLGGEVLARAGGTPVNLPGGELFTALQTGAIDATEWVGPYNDLAFGFQDAARYYYYPGWHEPTAVLEAIVNKEAYDALPDDLQGAVLAASQAANCEMLAEYTARNPAALKTLIEEHGVELRRFPDEVLATFKRISREVVEELAAADPAVARVYESYRAFQTQVAAFHKVTELPYLEVQD